MTTVNITENIVVSGNHGELIFEDTTTNKWFTVTEDQARAFIAAMHEINGGDLRVTKPKPTRTVAVIGHARTRALAHLVSTSPAVRRWADDRDPELERLLAEEDEIERKHRSQLT